jgi:uncharacterized membrane protein YesL
MEEHKPPRKPREVFLDLYYMSIPIISLNLYWLLLTLPVVTAPAAVMALFYCTNQMVKGDSAGWPEFWEGFRKYFWISLGWFLLDAAAIGILAMNIWFYQAQFTATWATIVDGLMIGILVVWLVVQFYVPAVLLMQEKVSIRQALRNAAGLVAFRPLVMAGTAVGLSIFYYLSTILFAPLWIFFTAGIGAYLISQATMKTVQRLLKQQTKGNPPVEPPPPSG